MDTKKTLIAGGVGIAAAVGLALTGASLANAEPSSTTAAAYGYSATPGSGQAGAAKGNGNTDPSKPMRSDETLLTGDVAAKVTAAAKAKEPTATIQRVETDSDGVYEAHMVRTDGTQIIVQIDKSYTVTNVQTMGAGGPGGQSGSEGQAPAAPNGAAPSGTATS